MITKITAGGKGSCIGLAQYLEKETPGEWFTTDKGDVTMFQVVSDIDSNKRNLGKQDDKYYQIILSPSQSEQKHIGSNRSQLESFTREAMQAYAKQFGKGIESQNLLWYAKIEQQRSYSHTDKAVQKQQQFEGQSKEGPQAHIHVIVSRTENLSLYQYQRETGSVDRKNPLKLSPATNHRATDSGAVKGGFDRSNFKQAVETQFDRQFNYERPLTETFQYANMMRKGSQEERIALRLEALQHGPNYSLNKSVNKQENKVNQFNTRDNSDRDLSL
ncbi:DUF5712 family protein [Spirosoma rhododendri]|uniref:Mobilization protein n=1 Tax=Spirosoma rhododendri TaxID=2728024 RepID=A0A7L5DVQ5_9BACT|nr:DUF5712 family protein [Spirosoma rhododendri]QJD81551.1 hypothetical protein HH216_24595 [Spirosoma rhododendri]